MSVTRINEFEAIGSKSEELYDFLKSLMSYISSSEGCLSVDLLRHKEELNKFVVIEKWESVEFHQKSIQDYPQEKMQAVMALFSTPPKGSYYKEYQWQ